MERLEDPGFFATSDFAAAPYFSAHDRLIVEVFGAHDDLAPVFVALLGPALPVRPFGLAPTLRCEDFRI